MADLTTVVVFVALMLGLTAPVVYFTWMSIRDDTHSPPTQE